jgi:hypothetical protein
MMGMFENIGSASTMRRSKFWPEDTVVVSSSDASAVTTICSVSCPTSSLKVRLTDWPTASEMPVWLNVLNPCSSTRTAYVPGLSRTASKYPLSLVTSCCV